MPVPRPVSGWDGRTGGTGAGLVGVPVPVVEGVVPVGVADPPGAVPVGGTGAPVAGVVGVGGVEVGALGDVPVTTGAPVAGVVGDPLGAVPVEVGAPVAGVLDVGGVVVGPVAVVPAPAGAPVAGVVGVGGVMLGSVGGGGTGACWTGVVGAGGAATLGTVRASRKSKRRNKGVRVIALVLGAGEGGRRGRRPGIEREDVPTPAGPVNPDCVRVVSQFDGVASLRDAESGRLATGPT